MRSFRLASGTDSHLLRQAARVERALEERCGETAVVAVPVEHGGSSPGLLDALGEVIQRAEADAAVCPAGMMSGGLPPGVELGALFRDGDPAYRWVSCGRVGPGALPHGARVVTWDDVSRAQILFRYPSLVVESARGWDRIFEGLRQGAWGAACLPPEIIDEGALWGLDTGAIAVDEIMPAIGQGAAAVLVAAGVEPHMARALNDPLTALRMRLESIFWWNACEVPSTVVTAFASFDQGRVRVEGMVAEADGLWLVSDAGEAEAAYGDVVAKDVAQSCLESAWSRRNRGAPALMDKAAAS